MSYFFVSVNNGFQLWIIERYYTISDNWNGKNIWELWFERLNCEFFLVLWTKYVFYLDGGDVWKVYRWVEITFLRMVGFKLRLRSRNTQNYLYSCQFSI